MLFAEQGRNTIAVKVKRRFAASPERVFDAWGDPEKARRFLFTHPGMQETVRAEIDFRVGGKFLFVVRRNGKDSNHFGEYLEIERPHRLVFTLCVPATWPDASRVQIVITPVGTGCELTLTHEDVSVELAARLEEGWTTFLNLLHLRLVRGVRVEATVQAPVSEVWRVWTTSAGAEEFFAEKANIRLAIGGPYEVQFDPNDERSGTKGLKVLSYLPEEMISFQWNAPPQYPEVRNGGTWVVVQMRPERSDRTHVTTAHLGWKEGAEWDQAYVHFTQGWSELMKRLERRFTRGPIDWNEERMMYQALAAAER